MRSEEMISIKKADLIAILRDLNMIVVSLDKIGSCLPETGRDANNKLRVPSAEWRRP
jgi:hypothetical protein